MGSAGFGSGSGSPLGSKLGSRLRVWFRSVVLRQRVESEMEEEIRFHLESRAEELERGGLSAREASRTARVEFGGVESHKDGMRASLGLRWLDELVVDVRYGVRLLRKSPGLRRLRRGRWRWRSGRIRRSFRWRMRCCLSGWECRMRRICG